VSSSASAELLFTAGAAALRGELALHDGEYALLAELNTTAAGHYGNMADLAAGLGVFASALNAKDASFTPFLGVMDAIEGQVRRSR
jgi:K+ transporter